MGKIHVFKNIKICANCQYWGGQRQTHIGRVMVIYDTKGKGKCSLFNAPMLATFVCPKHKILDTYK